MADRRRIADLRRRVEQDSTSIAFAQLAEELRRDGDAAEAIEVCRAGLRIHPDYLSARVTLGRALLASNQLDAAQDELARVLRTAPENLAALRAVADIWHRRGNVPEALSHYRAALSLAHNDPELQTAVAQLSREAGTLTEPPAPSRVGNRDRDRSLRTIAALEGFLGAVRERSKLRER
jgi:tetratricopeptide (TPR) repeat protein